MEEKRIETVSKIDMSVFDKSDPAEVLGLVLTPDKALDEYRKKVDEYLVIGCSDDLIAEALKKTTGKDFWRAEHIKKARARWKRLDKKNASSGAEKEHQTKKESVILAQDKTKPVKHESMTLRKLTETEFDSERNRQNIVYLRSDAVPPKVGEVFMMPSGARYKTVKVQEDSLLGMRSGYEVTVEKVTSSS